MTQTLDNSPETNNLPLILDIASGVGLVGGTIASLVSQSVAVVAIPFSLSVALSIINRRQIDQDMEHTQKAEIIQLREYITKNNDLISEHLKHFQQETNTQIHQQREEQQKQLTDNGGQLNNILANLTQEIRQLQQSTESLDSHQQQIEKMMGELRHIENFSQAIFSNPNSAEFYYQRGLSHQHLGDKLEAIEDYSEAIKLDSTHAQAYHNRGILNAQLGNKKRSAEDLRQAAKFYFEQGDIESYQKARDLSKEFYDVRQSLEAQTESISQPEMEDSETDTEKFQFNVSQQIAATHLFS